MPYDLIIFDCDGVLIDSEVISTQTLLETLVGHGLEVDIGYVLKTYLGRSFGTVQSDFLRLTGNALPEAFEAAFLARLAENYRRELSAMGGVRELIGGLSSRYCMATSSSIERATMALDVAGLHPLFRGRIFCASMVANGKPAPDLFLHAARTLGAEPATCLVIEDSEVGVQAARNAGMEVWRFVGGSHFEADEAARLAARPSPRSFRSMDDLAKALTPI